MPLVINHNLMASNVAKSLNSHYATLGTSTQRLSSGLRINSSADDAAGLAIRELQRADIKTLQQGTRNANDAISMIQTADGALGIIDEKLIRMKELAEQAATGTYDSTQRLMIDSEFQAMADEINRIAHATDFNGIHLLDGSLSGEHDGSGLTSKGALKVHFGTGNESAEDYYYVRIGAADMQGLFGDYEVEEYLPADATWVELPFGDPEGQNILALGNGNALVMVNDHSNRGLYLREISPDGKIVSSATVSPRIEYQPPDWVGGIVHPKEMRLLPNGDVRVAFSCWADPGDPGDPSANPPIPARPETFAAIGFTTYRSNPGPPSSLTVVPGSTHYTDNLAGYGLSGDDLAMSTTSTSTLVGAISNPPSNPSRVVLAMNDHVNDTYGTMIDFAQGEEAQAVTINDRHFLIVRDGQNLQGYYVDDLGTDITATITTAPLMLGQGSMFKMISLGDRAAMCYTVINPADQSCKCYARIINADGTMGNPVEITSPDSTGDSYWPDIDRMRAADGTYTDQVIVSWQNRAHQDRLFMAQFDFAGSTLTRNGESMRMLPIPAGSVGFNNITVLSNGMIAADMQAETGSIDRNFVGFATPYWVDETEMVKHFDITTQDKAQKMLERLEKGIIEKDNIRAHLGALQNRLENTISNLTIQAENLQMAESRISDTDVATEMTGFVRGQILTQAAVAMLAQANSLPKMAMQIIGG